MAAVSLAAAVHDAVKHDDVALLTKYLDSGRGPVESYDDGYWPLLISAARYGSIKCLSVLLDRGANIDTTRFNSLTSVHCAAANGQTEALTLLLDRGADVDDVENEGRTPLHYAVYVGHIECVQLLLERGANREIADNIGRTTMDYWTQIVNPEIAEQIKKLLQGGGQATKAAKPRFYRK